MLSFHRPSVGRHLCFERDKKRYRGTKNDITGQKTISRDISFLCHRVIALIKAQVCDNKSYQTQRGGVLINDENYWPVKLKHRSTGHIKWVNLHSDDPTVQSIVKETMAMPLWKTQQGQTDEILLL